MYLQLVKFKVGISNSSPYGFQYHAAKPNGRKIVVIVAENTPINFVVTNPNQNWQKIQCWFVGVKTKIQFWFFEHFLENQCFFRFRNYVNQGFYNFWTPKISKFWLLLDLKGLQTAFFHHFSYEKYCFLPIRSSTVKYCWILHNSIFEGARDNTFLM